MGVGYDSISSTVEQGYRNNNKTNRITQLLQSDSILWYSVLGGARVRARVVIRATLTARVRVSLQRYCDSGSNITVWRLYGLSIHLNISLFYVCSNS